MKAIFVSVSTKDKTVIDFVTDTDEGTVSALKELRLSADDFEVKSIIGRGHFGEVSWVTNVYVRDMNQLTLCLVIAVYSHMFITSVLDTVNNYTLSSAPLKYDPF